MALGNPRGVLFDLGDTILRQHVFDPRAGRARMMEIADNPRGVCAREVNELARAVDKDMRRRRDESLVEYRVQAFQRLVYEPFGITFPLSPQELELEFWRTANRMSPDPGLDDVLGFLEAHEIPTGIVSNSVFSGQTLLWALDQHRLADRFGFLMSSADYGFRKPHPLLFQAAVTRLGFPSEDVWFVGDSHADDIVGAANAGIGAILYTRQVELPDMKPGPDAIVRSWDEFGELFVRWTA